MEFLDRPLDRPFQDTEIVFESAPPAPQPLPALQQPAVAPTPPVAPTPQPNVTPPQEDDFSSMSERSINDEPVAQATASAPATQVNPNPLFEADPDPQGSQQGSPLPPPALSFPPSGIEKRTSGRSNKAVPPHRFDPGAFKKYVTGLPKPKPGAKHVTLSTPVAFRL